MGIKRNTTHTLPSVDNHPLAIPYYDYFLDEPATVLFIGCSIATIEDKFGDKYIVRKVHVEHQFKKNKIIVPFRLIERSSVFFNSPSR